MSEQRLTGQVVTEYLDKFPTASNLCLARIIYRDNIALFTNIEHARGLIRYYRGRSGKENRKYLSDKKYVK